MKLLRGDRHSVTQGLRRVDADVDLDGYSGECVDECVGVDVSV